MKERLGRLREGVDIMRQAWTTGSATLDGTYYQVAGAIVRPLPLQEGGIPIWVCWRRREGDPAHRGPIRAIHQFRGDPGRVEAKSALLKGHCDDLGTDFGAITRSANYNTVIGSTEAEVADRVEAILDRVSPYLGVDGTETYRRQYFGPDAPGVGTTGADCRRLTDMKARGLGYAIHNFAEAAYDRSGIELFEREVIPALSAAKS